MNLFLRQKINTYIGMVFVGSLAFGACFVILRAANQPDPLAHYTEHLAAIELQLKN
jgi:hypothetical protein